ncbi:phosphomannomutase/phosphoglucomutase [Amphritea sp. HPY]|uniref:phosphomannomutase/phosphoglucomutase n=1 Tax=Amphritea sp. HPY TaxID=3421652 RepID=UPI003D7D5CB6
MKKTLQDAIATIPAEIFRAYDIRGIYGKTLNADWAELIGLAIGSEARLRDQSSLTVAYDGRLSSIELSNALIRGLLNSGIDVINIGLAPTPALYYSTVALDTGSGVMVTGSHNPTDYNGFKIMLGGHTLCGDEISALWQRIKKQNLNCTQAGQLSHANIRSGYLQKVCDAHPIDTAGKPLKVAIDCGNGVPGPWITELLELCNCEVIPLFCDVDGTFPNHHPNPEEIENLQQLIHCVVKEQADIGLALDGDGDRLGVVTNSGAVITSDQLICLFADRLLQQHPGAEVVHDVKSSLSLSKLIREKGGIATMWQCGHSMIKNRMRQTNALMGGEFSGHLFFADHWYGFDDGLYSSVRLLSELAKSGVSADQLFAVYPQPLATPMINIKVSEAEKFQLIDDLIKQPFEAATCHTIDGLRVEYEDGWFGIRASNTTPVLTLRIEADNPSALARLQQLIKKKLKLVNPDLQIPELAVTNYTNTIDREP